MKIKIPLSSIRKVKIKSVGAEGKRANLPISPKPTPLPKKLLVPKEIFICRKL